MMIKNKFSINEYMNFLARSLFLSLLDTHKRKSEYKNSMSSFLYDQYHLTQSAVSTGRIRVMINSPSEIQNHVLMS